MSDIAMNPQAPAVEPVAESAVDPAAEPETPDVEALQTELNAMKAAAEQAQKAKTAAEQSLDFTKKEFSKFKKAHQTDEEKIAEIQKTAENEIRQARIERNIDRAAKLFANAQIVDADLPDGFLARIASDNADDTEDLVSDFVGIVVKQREAAAKAEREKVLRETPRPPAGGAESEADAAFGDKFMKALGL